MSLNNVLSLNGVIKQNNIANVNSNVFTNPNSNIHNITPYINQSSIDTNKYNINSINIEKTSLELSLNVLGIEHSKFETMSKQEFLYYFDNFKKQNSNVNKILASKIALKYKLSSSEDVNSFNYGQDLYQPNTNLSNQNNFYQPEKYQQQINNSFGFYNNQQPQQTQTQTQTQVHAQYQQQTNSYQQTQAQVNSNYHIEASIPEYTRSSNNSNIQKSKTQSSSYNPNTYQNINPNSKINKQNDISNFVPNQMNLQPNFKPVQIKDSDSNSSKYLASSNPTPTPMDKNSRDFDINSIIDNYTKQKNNGMGRNLDVSYSIPNTTNTQPNYNHANNYNQPNNSRPVKPNSDVSFV